MLYIFIFLLTSPHLIIDVHKILYIIGLKYLQLLVQYITSIAYTDNR